MKKYSQERKDMILQLVATGKPVAEFPVNMALQNKQFTNGRKTTRPSPVVR
jgi:transposase